MYLCSVGLLQEFKDFAVGKLLIKSSIVYRIVSQLFALVFYLPFLVHFPLNNSGIGHWFCGDVFGMCNWSSETFNGIDQFIFIQVFISNLDMLWSFNAYFRGVFHTVRLLVCLFGCSYLLYSFETILDGGIFVGMEEKVFLLSVLSFYSIGRLNWLVVRRISPTMDFTEIILPNGRNSNILLALIFVLERRLRKLMFGGHLVLLLKNLWVGVRILLWLDG